MRHLDLTRHTGLSLIIFISFGFCFLASTVKASGSFQLQVLALKMPDECRCRGSSAGSGVEGVSASSNNGDTYNSKNIRQNYNKTNFSFNVNQTSTVILDFLNFQGKDKGETQNKHDSKTGSINFTNAPSSTTSKAPHENGINTNSSGVRKTSGISDTPSPPSPQNSADINATKFEDETWSTRSSSTCKSLDLILTACLAHHQLRPAKDFKCTFGQVTSYQTISLKNLDTLVRLKNPLILSIPFSYAWPGAFTLRVVSAWKCGNHTNRDSMTVNVDSLVPSSKWIVLSEEPYLTVSNSPGEENLDILSEQHIDSPASKHPQGRTTHEPRNLARRDRKGKRSIHPYKKSNIHRHLKAKKLSIDREGSFKMVSKLKSTMKSVAILDAVAKEVFKGTSRERPPVSSSGVISAARMTPKLHSTSPTPRSLSSLIKQLSGTRDDKVSKRHPESISMNHRLKRYSRRRRNPLRFGALPYNMTSDRILDSIDARRYILNKSQDEKLLVAVRVLCSDNYYGANCTHFCRARDDFLGHFTCTATGQQVCTDGWRGPECSQAICSTRCLPSRSSCPAPNTCLCRPGWYGQHCDRCRPGTGCLHGTCSLPGQCVCHFGWTGPRCDNEEPFCNLHKPCTNGGTCTHFGQHNYKCSCPEGYKGRHCEIFVCYDGYCHHEGVCSVTQGTRTCQCPPLYSGSRCQFRVESQRETSSSLIPSLVMLSTSPPPLSSSFSSTKLSPKNASCSEITCTEKNRSSLPLATRGSCFGSLCDGKVLGEKPEAANTCQTLSCSNGGKCTDLIDTKTAFCSCPEPYIGTQCLENRSSSGLLSPCSSSPCLFGGTCFNIIRVTEANATESFSCKCLEGFSGDTCEEVVAIDTSICASTPCRNGGTCVEYDGEFFCACTDNFRGLLCEKRRKSRRVTRLKVKIETTFYSPSPSSPSTSSSSSAASSITTCHLVNKDVLDLTLIRRLLYLAIPVIFTLHCFF